MIVADPGEQPIPNAEVIFENLKLSARSNSAGAFQSAGVPAGTHAIVVRHVGYESFIGTLTFREGQEIAADFSLRSVSTRLEKVEIRDTIGSGWAMRLVDFEERRKVGTGRYLTAVTGTSGRDGGSRCGTVVIWTK